MDKYAEKLLDEAKQEAIMIAKFLYQRKTAEGYQYIDSFLEKIEAWIVYIEKEEKRKQQYAEELNRIQTMIANAFAAMKGKNFVFLADILLYGLEKPENIEKEQMDTMVNEIAWEKHSIRGSKNYQSLMLNEHELEISSIQATNQSSVLQIIKQGKSYYLNSCYSPEWEADCWSKQFNFDYLKQVVILIGLGNGIFAEKLKEAAKEDMHLIIYEPNLEIFDFVMKNLPIAELFGQKDITVLVEKLNEVELDSVLNQLLDGYNIKSLQIVVHPQYDELFPEECRKFVQRIKDCQINAIKNQCTIKQFGRKMVVNRAAALTYLKECQVLEQYIGKFPENVPAIIVAAGPSLDLNIDMLKEAKGKAVIMATDTSMRDLVEHHIQPDFIVTLDPYKPPEYLSAPECKEIPLICSGVANERILKEHRGKKIFYEYDSYLQKIRPRAFPRSSYCGSGGSVATRAFSACVAMKFKTVILIGQDLAYRNGISHAGGRMSGEKEHGDWLVEVEDINGNIIKTRREWYDFLLWYENTVAKLKDVIKVIDATEGGAKIHGTEIMSFEAAIKTYCTGEVDCQKIVEELGNAYTEVDYKKALEYVKVSLKELEKIDALIEQMIEQTEQLILLCEKKDFGETYQELAKSLKKMGDEIIVYSIYDWLDQWITDDVTSELSDIYNIAEESQSEMKMFRSSMEVYKNLRIAVADIRPVLKKAYEGMST